MAIDTFASMYGYDAFNMLNSMGGGFQDLDSWSLGVDLNNLQYATSNAIDTLGYEMTKAFNKLGSMFITEADAATIQRGQIVEISNQKLDAMSTFNECYYEDITSAINQVGGAASTQINALHKFVSEESKASLDKMDKFSYDIYEGIHDLSKTTELSLEMLGLSISSVVSQAVSSLNQELDADLDEINTYMGDALYGIGMALYDVVDLMSVALNQIFDRFVEYIESKLEFSEANVSTVISTINSVIAKQSLAG